MIIKKNIIKLDCGKNANVYVATGIKQGEVNVNQFEVSLTYGETEVVLGYKTLAVMVGVKPDDTKICNVCEIKDNKIIYTLDANDTSLAGVVNYQIIVYNNEMERTNVLVAPRISCVIESSLDCAPYVLLEEKPDDWEENYGMYFISKEGGYEPVKSADDWHNGKIYACQGLIESSENLPVLNFLINKVESLGELSAIIEKISVNDDGELVVTYADGRSENLGMLSGTDGLSAYEIAVKHGFVGTEEEWLESLKGKDGTNGNGNGTGWTAEQITLLETIGNHLVFTDDSTGQAMFDSLIASLRSGASSGGNSGGDNTGGESGGMPDIEYTDNIQITDIVSYYQEPTQAVADEVNALGDEYVSFVVVTDTHGTTNKNNSQNIIRYLLRNTKADKLFCLGDIVTNNWSETDYRLYFDPFTNCIPQVFFALGNHELYGGTMEDVSVIYEDLLSDKNYLKGNPERFYYYFDDTVRKIRYLVINTSDGNHNAVTNEQLEWIEESVQLPSDEWKLVAFGHMDIMPNDPIMNEWNTDKEMEITDALSSTNGTIVGYFCGHEHCDLIQKVNDGLSDKFYEIMLLNDSCYNDTTIEEIINPERIAGTVTEQAVSVVSINTSTGDVTIRRIGAGKNVSYNYNEGLNDTENPDSGDDAQISGTTAWFDGVAYDVTKGITEDTELFKGEERPYNGWCVTDYMYCKGASQIVCSASNVMNVSYCAWYDENKNYLLHWMGPEGNVSETTVPKRACYFRISSTKNALINNTFTPYATGGVVPPEETTNWTDNAPYEFDFVEKKFIDYKGDYVDYATYGTTPLLPCHGAEKITLTAQSGTTAIIEGKGSYFYGITSDGQISLQVGSVSPEEDIFINEENQLEVYVPINAYYVAICGKETSENSSSIYNLIVTPYAVEE